MPDDLRMYDAPMRSPSLALAGLVAGLTIVGCKRQQIDAPCLPGSGYSVDGKKHRLGDAAPTYDPDNDVVVRPLGAAGLYVEWRGNGVLISPQFTGYPTNAATAATRRVSPDAKAIAAGLAHIDKSAVQAILVGSASYDRLADVVAIAKALPSADVFVNESGRNIMAAHIEGLEGRTSGAKKIRVRSMNGEDRPRLGSQAVWLRGSDGTEIPIRVRAFPLPTPDAEPQAELEDEWKRVRLGDFFEGRRHAFVVDMFDATRANAMFRMLVVGSGSEVSLADTGTSELDLVVAGLRMHAADGNGPSELLEDTRAAHVMFIDYATDDGKGRLALHPDLEREWIGESLCAVDRALKDTGLQQRAPRNRNGSMHGDYWTMPLPGEWMVISAALEGAAGQVASDPLVEARDGALAQVNDLDLDGAQKTLAGAVAAARSGGRAKDPMLAPLLALQAAVVHSSTADAEQTTKLLSEAVALDYYVSVPIELRTDELAALVKHVQAATSQPTKPVIATPPKRDEQRGLLFKALVQVPLPDGAQMVLYWRKVGTKEYQSVEMHRFGNVVTGLVPATEHRGADVEYFIYAFDSAYKPLANDGDRDNPLKAFAD